MDIEPSADGKQVRLRVRGRLVREDGAVLQETVEKLVDEGFRRILVDFREVSDIDSAGLGALVTTAALARARGVEVRIEHATDRGDDLLSRTKLR